MRKIVFVLLALFFTACSIKDITSKDKLYDKVLIYTKRGEIVSSLETKALIDAVYLNPLYKDKFHNPTFLVGVYNDFDNTLINEEFNLILNNKPPLEINSTIPKFVLYKQFPFYNDWMKYYVVEFNKTSPLILEYKSKHWGETKLRF